jgi:hypothetical protein
MTCFRTAMVVASAAVCLAACGASPSTPRVASDVGGKPTWGDCHERSGMNIDYVAGARGKPSAAAAIARYRVPGDHVVMVPAHAHRNAQWLLVDDHNLIHASLELWHTPRGWLVSMVEKCAD